MLSLISSLAFDALSLLAWQDAAPSENAGTTSPLMTQLLNPLNLILFSMILYFLLVLRPQRSDFKKLQQQLASLKKNDRVVTSGGIHGVIVQASSEETTVVIRIDENSGARMTVNRDAIARVVDSDGESSKK